MSAADAPAAAAGELQKPKRAASAYFLYNNEIREEVMKEQREKNGGKANLGAVAKEVSIRWAALGEAEKKVHEEKAAEDRLRYAKEYAAYLEASDPAGTLRKKYQDLIPKKPMTAYFLFSQDAANREKAAEALKAAGTAEPAMKQITSKLAEMWKAASAEEKAPFEERCKKEQAEFLEKQKVWQATPQFAEIEKAEKAQEEKKKQEAAEAEQPEGEETKGRKRGRSVAKEAKEAKEPAAKAKEPKEPAEKKAKAAEAKPARKEKRGAAPEPEIDAGVLAEATKAGLGGSLRNLAARPEIVASGKSSKEILAALQASCGLVHPAKRALLGA